MNQREKVRLVNTAISQTMNLYRIWAKKNQLNYNTLLVLYTLDDLKECTQKEICNWWALPKQTVHGILLDLQKNGYVKLVTSEKNKRERIVSLTPSGQEYANSHLTTLYLLEETAMQKMGEELQEQFIRANTKYYELFKEEIAHVR